MHFSIIHNLTIVTMKKSIIFLFLMSTYLVYAQLTPISTSATYTGSGCFQIVDINKDGKLDFLFASGNTWDAGSKFAGRYLNQSTNTFTETVDNVVNPGAFATFSLSDSNGDGKFDLAFGGANSSGIILGLGTDEQYLNQTWGNVSMGFCDFYNTGYYGFYMIGGAGKSLFPRLENTYGWAALGNAGAIWTQNVSMVDFDNDGDYDIFVTGSEAPDWASGYMYVNTNGVYTATSIGVQKYGSNTSTAWADVNNDGFLDLLIGGTTIEGSGTDESNSYVLYINNGNGTLSKSSISFAGYKTWSSGKGAVFADWNIDGFMDVIVSGTGKLDIYLNNGSGTAFTLLNSGLPGLNTGNLDVADMNGDGKIDLLISGVNSDYTKNNVLSVFYNQTTTTNAAPTVPANLQSAINGNKVTLSWNAGTDDTTPVASLSYNLYVKNTTTGRYFVNPIAEVDGVNNGLRYTSGLGNIFMNKSWTLNDLPDGDYEWSVQSVDAAYAGSVFGTKGNFTLGVTTDSKKIESYVNYVINKNHIIISGTENSKINIYSTDGKAVKSIESNHARFETTLNPGSYILVIDKQGTQIRRKIII